MRGEKKSILKPQDWDTAGLYNTLSPIQPSTFLSFHKDWQLNQGMK